MVGFDGEKLKYRGVGYSKRTYDIWTNVTEGDDGWEYGYIAFYAVPNGCYDYAIACGDQTENGYGYKAYYKIHTTSLEETNEEVVVTGENP